VRGVVRGVGWKVVSCPMGVRIRPRGAKWREPGLKGVDATGRCEACRRRRFCSKCARREPRQPGRALNLLEGRARF